MTGLIEGLVLAAFAVLAVLIIIMMILLKDFWRCLSMKTELLVESWCKNE